MNLGLIKSITTKVFNFIVVSIILPLDIIFNHYNKTEYTSQNESPLTSKRHKIDRTYNQNQTETLTTERKSFCGIITLCPCCAVYNTISRI